MLGGGVKLAGKPWRRIRWAVLGAVALLGLTGCGIVTAPESTFNPAGPVARLQLSDIVVSALIMTGIFIIVAGILVVAIIRFRARKGHERDIPPQIEGNTTLELIWTIVPFMIIAFLGVLTVSGSFTLGEQPPTNQALVVKVTGHQFWWAFQYPSQNITTANDLHIPVGKKIDLEMTSADVMHAFWVPRLGGKQDLIPGRTTYMWFEASRPGIYTGQCAEFCGTGHAYMRIIVDAQPKAQFAKWVQQMTHPVSTPTSPLAKEGEHYFMTVGCSACHTIAGTNAFGIIGPNLTDLTARPKIAGNSFANTPANLARWIANPPKMKPGALMPKLPLTHHEITAIVAYLEDLR